MMRAAVVFLSGVGTTASTQASFDDESSLCLLQKVASVKPVWHSVDLNPAPEHLAVLQGVQERAAMSLASSSAAVRPQASESVKAEWHSVDLNPAPEHASSAAKNTMDGEASLDRQTSLEKSLSSARQAAIEQISLSSASVKPESFASVSADLNGNADLDVENAAKSAALSEDGYSAVAALGNRELMRAYVRRVAKDEGLMITNEGSLSGALAYYTGECSTQSYAALVRELWRGTETAKCKQAWVEPVKASSLLQMSSHPHKSLSTASSVTDDEPDSTWRWADDLESSLGVLQAELMNLKTAVIENEEKELMEVNTGEEEEAKNNEITNGSKDESNHTIDRESNHGGNHHEIPLDQEGYEQLAAKGNTTEMALFVRRVAEHEGFKVTNTKPLTGMSRYYSGECATQSFEALKNELHRVAKRSNARCGGGPWLMEQ